MAISLSFSQVFLLFLCLFQTPGTHSVLMTKIKNSCEDTIWPAFVSKPHSSELPKNSTGFTLRPGESKIVSAPANWDGTLWGRTHCSGNTTAHKFTCGTGDCGSSALECPRGTAAPAATTLAEFTPKGAAGEYAYSVSLAKGFNLPMTVVPRGYGHQSISDCKATGCVADLNKECPEDVQVVRGNDVIGCNSACEAFKETHDHYCGRSSTYSDHFKGLCPGTQAYENDKTNTFFSCASADYYDVNFCASSFPSSSPPFVTHSTASSPEVYGPGEELWDDGGKSTPLLIKIIASISGTIVGGPFLMWLVRIIWSRYQRADHSRPFFCHLKLIFDCCSNWICNCCTKNSNPPKKSPEIHHVPSNFPKQREQIMKK